MSSAADRQAAADAQQKALDIIKQTGAPPDESQAILLDQYKQAGILTPQLEQSVTQQFSQVANIKEDQGLRTAQTNALQQMQQQGQTGFNAQDIASLNAARSQAQTDAQAKSAQIQQSLQAKGNYGSGTELAAQLAAGQQGAQRESQAGIQQAGVASQRALEALVAGGQEAGQIRQQDFNVANTKAQAADAMNKFNTQNQIAAGARNADRTNAANQYNLTNQQQVANMNTQQANAEKYRQAAAQRQYWQDQLTYNGAQANAELGYAQNKLTQGNTNAQGWTSGGAGVAAGAGAVANYYGNGSSGGGGDAQGGMNTGFGTGGIIGSGGDATGGFAGDEDESGWGGGGSAGGE